MPIPDYFSMNQVFDIVIHRYLEIDPVVTVAKTLDMLLESMGGLYKFHGEENGISSTLITDEKKATVYSFGNSGW